MRTGLNKFNWFCIPALLIALFVFQATAAGQELSDDRKKEIVYGMYDRYKKDFPDVADISPRDAMALMEAGRVVFVDVREPAEMEVSMLPGAISRAEFYKDPSRHSGKTIVAYCTISYRSGIWVRDSTTRKIPLHNLTGGILAWVLEGGKVYDKSGETRRIHVYGKEWSYPPRGYEAVRYGFFERFF